MRSGTGRAATAAFVALLNCALLVPRGALAESISFYCVYTGLDGQGRTRYVFGPSTAFRPAACPTARAECEHQGLGRCRPYGLFRKA
jgi:hypothetical protein